MLLVLVVAEVGLEQEAVLVVVGALQFVLFEAALGHDLRRRLLGRRLEAAQRQPVVLLHGEGAHLVFQRVLRHRTQSPCERQRHVLTITISVLIDFLLDDYEIIWVNLLELLIKLNECNTSSVLVVTHDRVVEQHCMHFVCDHVIFATR